ncbi:MAG: hypothetical protein R3B93_06705 [Bacteroidia bacterium]
MDINRRLVNTYLELISQLGFNSKLELISRLSSSMKKKKKSSDESFFNLFGSFSDERSAEEIINDIKNARTFNREIESFD